VIVLVCVIGRIVAPQIALADESPSGKSNSGFSCARGYEGFTELAQSEASFDLYHGLAYLGASAAIDFGSTPKRHWSRKNDFDTGIRDGLRLGSSGSREDANLASDFTLAFSVAILPAATIGAQFSKTHDCIETWDMVTDAFESIGLSVFVTQVIKLAAGRDRPYTEECDGSPPDDAKCGKDDRHLSFYSGHASLAAAGAGLTCSYAIKREAWGTSRTAKAAPCALGAAAALTTGALRIASDKHWGSDVLMGFAVGAVIGYFDTWGPLDLLKFDTRDSAGKGVAGIVMPEALEGRLGARLIMVF
jgi:hypothetical protein